MEPPLSRQTLRAGVEILIGGRTRVAGLATLAFGGMVIVVLAASGQLSGVEAISICLGVISLWLGVFAFILAVHTDTLATELGFGVEQIVARLAADAASAFETFEKTKELDVAPLVADLGVLANNPSARRSSQVGEAVDSQVAPLLRLVANNVHALTDSEKASAAELAEAAHHFTRFSDRSLALSPAKFWDLMGKSPEFHVGYDIGVERIEAKFAVRLSQPEKLTDIEQVGVGGEYFVVRDDPNRGLIVKNVISDWDIMQEERVIPNAQRQGRAFGPYYRARDVPPWLAAVVQYYRRPTYPGRLDIVERTFAKYGVAVDWENESAEIARARHEANSDDQQRRLGLELEWRATHNAPK
jgi:hypothetical protein